MLATVKELRASLEAHEREGKNPTIILQLKHELAERDPWGDNDIDPCPHPRYCRAGNCTGACTSQERD